MVPLVTKWLVLEGILGGCLTQLPKGESQKKKYLPVSLIRYTQEPASVVVFSIFAHYYSPNV